MVRHMRMYIYCITNFVVIATFLWTNLVWAGGVECFKLSAPSQVTAIVPVAKIFATGQMVVKQIAEEGIRTKGGFYKRLGRELKKGKLGYLSGVPCLVFSDRDDPSKLAYYVFSPDEPYFSRITNYTNVEDSLWDFLKLIGIDQCAVSDVRRFGEEDKLYYQQVFAIDDTGLEFINTCLRNACPEWEIGFDKRTTELDVSRQNVAIERVRDGLKELQNADAKLISDKEIMEVIDRLRNGRLKLKGEDIDVLNEDGQTVLGRIDRNIAYDLGLWHRTVHVLVVNMDGDVLLQKRAKKPGVKSAGKWDISSGGHVRAGMTPDGTVLRELREELGFELTQEDLIKVGDDFRKYGNTDVPEGEEGYADGVYKYYSKERNREFSTLYIFVTGDSEKEINDRIRENAISKDPSIQEVSKVKYFKPEELSAKFAKPGERAGYASGIKQYFVGEFYALMLGRIEKALKKAIGLIYPEYTEEDFIAEILASLFALRQRQVEENGIDREALEKIKKHFHKEDGVWVPDKIIFQPSGIVLKVTGLTEEFRKVQDQADKFFGQSIHGEDIFYKTNPEEIHVTLVSYGHYSAGKKGLPEDYMPDRDIEIIKRIIAEFGPITVKFRGIQIMHDGCVIAKGFVEEDDIFRLRRQIVTRIPETGKSIPAIVHVNLGRLLNPNISKERIKEFHSLFGDILIGEEIFINAVSYNGRFLPFGESAFDWHREEGGEKPFVIAIDIGGTNFRIGIVKPDGTLIPNTVMRFSSPSCELYPDADIDELHCLLIEEILKRVEEVRELYPTLNLKDAGISIAGPVDSHGVILNGPTLWGTKSSPLKLKEELSRRMSDINWQVLNDLSAASYRYGLMGENKNFHRLAIFTVSTGLGGKIFDIDKGEVLLDENGMGGEPGHVRYDLSPDAPLCNCGETGHLEAFSAGRTSLRNAIMRAKGELKGLYEASSIYSLTNGNPDNITNQMIAEAANADDKFALEIVDRITLPLAVTIKNYVKYFGVDRVVIMGSFAMSIGTPYMNSLKRALQKIGISDLDKLIVFAEPDDDHGLVGAVRYVQENRAISYYGVKEVMDTKGDSEFEVSVKRDIVHRLITTQGVFDENNDTVSEYCDKRQILVCLDKKLEPEFETRIRNYFDSRYGNGKVQYINIGGDGIDAVLSICRHAKKREMDRHCIFIAVGDRNTMNITGLAAQFFRRGVDYIYIPASSVDMAETELAPEPVIKYDDVKLGSFYPPMVTIAERRVMPEINKKFSMVSRYRKYRFMGIVNIDSDSISCQIINNRHAGILSQATEEFSLGREMDTTALDKAIRPLAITICEQALAIGIEKFIITGPYAQKDVLDSIRRNLRQIGMFTLTDEKIDQLVELGDEETKRLILWLTTSNGDFKTITDDLGNEGYEFKAPADVRYSIVDVKDLFDQKNGLLADYCKKKSIFVCVDENVYKLYGGKIRRYFYRYRPDCRIITVPSTEEKKSMESVLDICRKAKEAGLDEDGVFIVIGGGVVMDIVGLSATIYEGGIPYIRVPTTLLGIVDAGVGIKTGVNFSGSKNFLGSFYPPLIAINDESFLDTLDERALRCGIAEMIKMAIVADSRLFELIEMFYNDILEKELSKGARFSIKLSIWAILKELQKNLFERETHERLPDFDHPFGHIFESLSSYELAHGEAVAIDMVMTSYIAYRRGLLPGEDFFRILTLLKDIGLPVYHPVCSMTDEIMEKIRDAVAHRGGSLNMTIPTGIGQATFTQEMNREEVRDAAEFLKAMSSIERIPFNELYNLRPLKDPFNSHYEEQSGPGESREAISTGLLRPSMARNDNKGQNDAYKSLVIDKERNISIEVKSMPECGPKDMILSILYAGVCGTDIKIVKGSRESKPGVIGHECIAMVVETGNEVKGFNKGDLVTLNPNDPEVRHNIIGHDSPGVFSQVFLAAGEVINKGQVIKIPPSLISPTQAIFIEPLALAVHSLTPFREYLKGKTVAMVGAGQMGRMHALLAKAYGAKKVILMNRSLPNLEFSVGKGIVSEDDCVLLNESAEESVRGVDLVVLSTESAITYIREAVKFVSNGGKILIFGGSREGDVVEFPGGSIDCYNLRLNNERKMLDIGGGKTVEFIGGRGIERGDFIEAMDLLATGKVKTYPLMTYVVSLEDLPEVLKRIDKYRGKVVVDMRLKNKVILSAEEWEMLISGGMDKKKTAIIGTTRDLGSRLADYLLDKGYYVTALVRPQSIKKFRRRVKDSVNIVQGDIYSINYLQKIISQNTVIFQMAGMVGLNFQEKDYPFVLAANGFVQGLIISLIKKLKKEGRIRLIYPSTQRVRRVCERMDVQEWVEKAISEFNNVVEDIIQSDNAEEKILSFVTDFIKRNPVPANLNIYELSKLLGERFIERIENSVILRISDVYGPGYAGDRSISRIVKTMLTGGERRERNRIIPPIYVDDINEVLAKCAELDQMHFGRYGMIDLTTGLEVTKGQIVDMMEGLVMPKGGVVIDDSTVQPSGEVADTAAAQELLGRPFTPFGEESLRQLMAYLMEDNSVLVPPLSPPNLIVFDVGGTTTRAGIFASTGKILSEVERFRTPSFKTNPGTKIEDLQNMLLDRIISYIKKIQKRYPELNLSHAAISFAGTIKDNGVIGKAASLWGGAENYPIKQKLEERLPGINYYIINDVVSASWRYGLMPRYRDKKNMCVLTISSGIGYKLFNPRNPDISDSHVVSLGHVRIDYSPSALQCECGEIGHLAAYASGRDAERRLRVKAVSDLEGFRKSSLHEMARKKISTITPERHREILEDRVTKDILRSIPEEIKEKEEIDIAGAIILENEELCSAINGNDPFALSLLDEITLLLAREIVRVAEGGVDKIVIMGGFALAIKDNFIRYLIRHMKAIGVYGKDEQYFDNLFDCAEGDDNDGIIGVGQMIQYIFSSEIDKARKGISESLELSKLIELRDSVAAKLRINKGKLTSKEENLLKRAFLMAYIAHNILPEKPQLGDDGRMFLYHPLEVARYLAENLGIVDVELIAAAFIHDVVEHTPVTREQVEFYFGKEILNIVLDLSQDAKIQHMDINELRKRGFDVEKIARMLEIDKPEYPKAVIRIARIAMKQEHVDRLLNRPLDKRSRLLKVVDNIVNYSSIDRLPADKIKKRGSVELMVFRRFAEAIDLPDRVREDICFYIDRLLSIGKSGPIAKEGISKKKTALWETKITISGMAQENRGTMLNKVLDRIREEQGPGILVEGDNIQRFYPTRKIIKKNIKKVLLLRAYPPDSPYRLRLPLSLAYLYTALKQRFGDGIEVDVLDLANQYKDFDIEKFVSSKDYDLIGISTISSIYGELSDEIAGRIRKVSPGSLIIAGGVYVSSSPMKAINSGLYDAVFIKDGEVSLCDFIHRVSTEDGDISQVKGIWYVSENGQICSTGDPEYADLNGIDLMIGLDIFNFDDYEFESPYFNGEKAITLFTSRGCPHRCSFCCVGSVSGRRYRTMSVPILVGLLKQIKEKYGLINFNFDNDIFTYSKRYVMDFCNAILTEPGLEGIRWKITTRADLLDKEMLDLMHKAGLVYIAIAPEVIDNNVLNNVNKALDLKVFREIVPYARRLGIKVRYFLMVGLPGMNEDSIDRTIRFIHRYPPDEVFVTREVPYPGIDIGEHPELFEIDVLDHDHKNYWMRDNGITSDFGADGARVEDVLIETNEMTREEIAAAGDRIRNALPETPLSGLLENEVRQYIIKCLSSGYGELGFDRDLVERFIQILCFFQNDPGMAIREVRKQFPQFTPPDGEFYKKYIQYRNTGRYAWIYESVPQGFLKGNILDIGCGNNSLGEYIIRHFSDVENYTGTDVIRYPDLKTREPRLRYICAENSPEINIEDNSIDTAMMIYTLHHIPYNGQLLTLKNLYRKLKEEGAVIIMEDTYSEKLLPRYDIDNLTTDFIKLAEDQRDLVLMFSDWLTNSSLIYPAIPDTVPLPGSFRIMEDWVKLFKEAGFEVEKQEFLGVSKDRVHRVPAGVFILRKKNVSKIKGEDKRHAKEIVDKLAQKGYRLISQTERELLRSRVEVDLRKECDQRELSERTKIMARLFRDVNYGNEMMDYAEKMASKRNTSNMFKISLRLAKSKLYVDAIKSPLKVSVVFGVYTCRDRMSRHDEDRNGEDALRVKIRQLEQLFGDNTAVDWQLFIVDDGSPNESGRFAEDILKSEYPGYYEAGKTKVIYLQDAIDENLKNPEDERDVLLRGMRSARYDSRKGGAIVYGMGCAIKEGADIVIFTDSDTSSHLGLAGMLIEPLLEEDMGTAVGSREMPDSLVLNRPFKRRIQSWQDTIFYNWLVIKPFLPLINEIRDTQNGFKAFKREVLERILRYSHEKGMAFDTELLLLTKKAGYRIKEVGMPWVDTPERTSVTLMDGVKMARSILLQRKRDSQGAYDVKKTEDIKGNEGENKRQACIAKKQSGGYAELMEIGLNEGRLGYSEEIDIGSSHPKFGSIDKVKLQEVLDRLSETYGLGIFAVIDYIKVIDNIKPSFKIGPYAMVVKENGRNILLLDVDAFSNEELLYIVLEHELKESIMGLVPVEDDAVRELTTNFMSLKSALEKGVRITSSPIPLPRGTHAWHGSERSKDRGVIDKKQLEELGADLQFFEALEVLQAMKDAGEEVTDEKIIAVAIEHMRGMPYYAGLFRKFSFSGDWEDRIKDIENRYKAALKVFNDTAEAKEMAGKVKETEKIAITVIKTFTGLRIQGLDRLSKRLAGIIACSVKVASKLHETASLPLAKTGDKYCIVLDKDRVPEELRDDWERRIKGLEDSGMFKVVYLMDEALKEYEPENIIHLIDTADIKEEMPRGILYLPMPYLRSSLYMAAVVISSGGDVNKLNPLVRGLIGDLYSQILGRSISAQDLEKLFKAPWLILPEIRDALGEIHKLRQAILQIEKAA